ncbi:MAG: site-specific DNA-methyltransferase [Spirochaetaceae bacterium]|jgi:modification methylase|nr:site-specific DNA-methyltransferase [Spirochaetaceae bacterium]
MELNTVIQGDCVRELGKLPDASVDLIFADPPYNLQLKHDLFRPNCTRVSGVDDEWDKFASFSEYDGFCTEWLKGCRRVLKNTGAIWVIGSYHNIFRLGALMMDMGFWILNDVTWLKTNPMPNFHGSRFTNATETLLWCSKGESCRDYTFNHKLMKKYNGGKQMTSVWRISLCSGGERLKNADGRKAHSTQKPEELLKRVILSTTKQNDVVLDPFFGTGTTGAVAKKLKRNFIGIERDAAYAAMAKNRIDGIKDFFEEAAWLEGSGEKRIRVPFEELIRERMISEGDALYSPKAYGAKAFVLADGRLKYNDTAGSIHRIGAMIQQTPSCNGWKFWYTARGEESVPIDELRSEYLKMKRGL